MAVAFPYACGLVIGTMEKPVMRGLFWGIPVFSGSYALTTGSMSIMNEIITMSPEYKNKMHDPIEEKEGIKLSRMVGVSAVAGVLTAYAPELYLVGRKVLEIIQQYM